MAVYTAIDDAGLFFNTVLYTGTGSSNAITGAGFQPDATWIKGRNTAYNHVFTDSVRGVTEEIYPNVTDAEVTNANGLTAFGADGFTVGSDAGYNESAKTYASWNWKAGTTSGITTDGSTTITPSAYSFNQTSGFSAVVYTGNSTNDAKVAHGLGAAPGVVMVKKMNSTGQWTMHHPGLTTPARYGIVLNVNTAEELDNYATWSFWYNTNPDSVNFTLGDSTGWNNSGDTYVAYCWAEKQGYSKFGSYIGNGNADGTFVYTGFKVAFVWVKQRNGTGNWIITDDARDPYNVADKELYCNNTGHEGVDCDYYVDFCSNGLKWRGTGAATNGNTNPYIYLAFAESPLVNSGGVPTTAR